MPTAIGTNTITSIVDRYLLPQITDNVYNSNPLIFRLIKGNKKIVQGGPQIEAPIMLSDFTAGGFYQGLDLLNMVPQDTIKNAVWDWKQAYVPLVFDGLTLAKTDSPNAIANLIQLQTAQAQMKMAEVLAAGIWSGASGSALADPKTIDGIPSIVDNAFSWATYGGLSRSTYTAWKAASDALAIWGNAGNTVLALTLANLQTIWSGANIGGRAPSIIVSRQDQYNRFWNLAYTGGTNSVVQHTIQGGAVDEQLFSAGFHNVLFNGVPWVVDSHVPLNATSGATSSMVYMLNEDFLNLVVSPRGDMVMEDFQTPIGQDAIAAKLLWYGNLISTSPRAHAVGTRFTS